EERVDFRRLHRYRLARTRQALAESGLGAMLCFDQHNIRYISSTVIGEWARDKLIRYCLLSGNGDPWVWDFGSAARHHKLYCPWLHEDHIHAGNPGMRGAIGPEVGLFQSAAKEIKDILVKEGVADMPLGLDVCEPGMLFALQPSSAQLHRSFDSSWGPGVLRHHPFVHGLPHVLLPHVLRRKGDRGPDRRVQTRAPLDGRRHLDAQARCHDRQGGEDVPEIDRDWLRNRDGRL